MIKRNILVWSLLLLSLGIHAQYEDLSKQRFSIGIGKMFVRHYFPSHFGNNELVHDKIHRGIYVDLDFMWNRIGFKTGIQWADRDFYEKLPDNGHVYRTEGMDHAASMRIIPLLLTGKLINTKPVELIAGVGIAISRISDYVTYDKNYNGPPYSKPYEEVYRRFIPTAELDIKWNLYKKDIYLGTHLQYGMKPKNSVTWGHLSGKFGLIVNISNIIYKDKIKTFPAKGASPMG